MISCITQKDRDRIRKALREGRVEKVGGRFDYPPTHIETLETAEVRPIRGDLIREHAWDRDMVVQYYYKGLPGMEFRQNFRTVDEWEESL